MELHGDTLALLIWAIQEKKRVRLAYERQADGVTSVHEVAPFDVRPGETARTSKVGYLWAWCYSEARPEMHILHRIRKVVPLSDGFDPSDLLSRWPKDKWPPPSTWVIPREW